MAVLGAWSAIGSADLNLSGNVAHRSRVARRPEAARDWRARARLPVVDRLPHGYTNRSRFLASAAIEKRYDGPARWANARRECACLDSLHGTLPVPRIIERDLSVPMIVTEALGGRHGQDLIDDGHAADVLRLVGQ